MKPFRVAITQPKIEKVNPDLWLDILAESKEDAVQKAISYCQIITEMLPMEVHVSRGKNIWDTGVPMCCDTLTIDKEN
jgi:hypothetical protein